MHGRFRSFAFKYKPCIFKLSSHNIWLVVTWSSLHKHPLGRNTALTPDPHREGDRASHRHKTHGGSSGSGEPGDGGRAALPG